MVPERQPVLSVSNSPFFIHRMGNSPLPTVLDKLNTNVTSTIHLRKFIATLVRENGQRDAVIDKLEERIGVLEHRLNEIKNQPKSILHSRIRDRSRITLFNWPPTQRHYSHMEKINETQNRYSFCLTKNFRKAKQKSSTVQMTLPNNGWNLCKI